MFTIRSSVVCEDATALRRWGVLVGGILFLLAASGEPVYAQDSTALQHRAEALSAHGDSLREDRQFDAAMEVYREARVLYRRLGDRGQEAEMTNEIGILFAYDHQYDSALRHLQQAVEGYRAVDDDIGTAKALNNIAILHRRRGAYEKALEHYRRVLPLYDKERRSDRAVVLNNLGLVHEDMGRYDKALYRFREALAVQRTLEHQEGVARSLKQIGDILRYQGRYAEALKKYRESLNLYRKLGTDTRIANTLSGIGTIHFRRQQYDRALTTYQKVLDIYRTLDDRSRLANTLNNVGAVYQRQGRDREALAALRKALRINREVGHPGSAAISLNEIGSVYQAQGKYEKALSTYREALRINRDLERSAHVATSLYRIGVAELHAGRYAAADSVLDESTRITESLLETVSGANRRDFLAQEISHFHTLVTARVRAGKPEAALRAYERSRARLLADRLANEEQAAVRVPSIDSMQAALAPKEAAVLYANTDTERPIVALLVTPDSVKAHEMDADSVLTRAKRRYEDGLDRLRQRKTLPWTQQRASLLQQAKGVRIDADAEQQFANLVRLYRHELSVSRAHQLLSPARRKMLGQFLYSVLIDPIEERLRSVEELVIVPDGAMSYLPFETLSDWNGERVIDNWRVRYVQSLRVLRLLQQRHRSVSEQGRRPLLAFGGGIYEPDSHTADTSGFGPETVLMTGSEAPRSDPHSTESQMQKTTYTASKTHRPDSDSSALPTYQAHGYGPDRWQNLSSSVDEVRALSQTVGRSTVLLGEAVREQTVRAWSRNGALANYRAIHFATHGFVVPEEPDLSALVLSEAGESRQQSEEPSPVRKRTGKADGYLNIQEIAELDLQADFVGLSACQTGLGRIYRGSGAVSLAQGFLRAGAGSVAVSLWAVEDASTSRFMEAVYQRVWRHDESWSEAIAQTKRHFATGTYGTRLQSPRFWAPFVYYGWETKPPQQY